jgi:hypothetical protein
MCSRDGCATKQPGLICPCSAGVPPACAAETAAPQDAPDRFVLVAQASRLHLRQFRIPNSEFLIRELLQLPEDLKGLIGLDPLLERYAVVGGEDPADALGVAFFVTPDVGAE